MKLSTGGSGWRDITRRNIHRDEGSLLNWRGWKEMAGRRTDSAFLASRAFVGDEATMGFEWSSRASEFGDFLAAEDSNRLGGRESVAFEPLIELLTGCLLCGRFAAKRLPDDHELIVRHDVERVWVQLCGFRGPELLVSQLVGPPDGFPLSVFTTFCDVRSGGAEQGKGLATTKQEVVERVVEAISVAVEETISRRNSRAGCLNPDVF
jgi:hypothetical protein